MFRPPPQARRPRPSPETRLANLIPSSLRHHLHGRLGAETVPVADLDAPTRAALWELYRTHYDRTDEARFFADLDGKHDIILLRDLSNRTLVGFSTLHTAAIESHRAVVIFSGDTIIAAPYQGQSALQREFVRYILSVVRRARGVDVYWFLISKGYKTYLLLSRNFHSYWPRHDRPTPPAVQDLLDTSARARFGDAYDPTTGLIRFDPPGPRLYPDVAPLPDDLAPDVAFFVHRNPNHADGDELCCLGKVDLELGLGYAWRLARKTVRRLTGNTR